VGAAKGVFGSVVHGAAERRRGERQGRGGARSDAHARLQDRRGGVEAGAGARRAAGASSWSGAFFSSRGQNQHEPRCVGNVQTCRQRVDEPASLILVLPDSFPPKKPVLTQVMHALTMALRRDLSQLRVTVVADGKDWRAHLDQTHSHQVALPPLPRPPAPTRPLDTSVWGNSLRACTKPPPPPFFNRGRARETPHGGFDVSHPLRSVSQWLSPRKCPSPVVFPTAALGRRRELRVEHI